MQTQTKITLQNLGEKKKRHLKKDTKKKRERHLEISYKTINVF